MHYFTDLPLLIQGVLLVWSLLILYAGGRFVIRVFQTIRNRPGSFP